MKENKINYETFLPEVALHIAAKKDADEVETLKEIKAAVQTVYRSAVSEFMRDSDLYRVEIPIDVYENVDRYELIAPKGYFIQNVISLKEHKINIPKNCYDQNEIRLACCPNKSVNEAFYAEVSLVPKRSAHCEFDCDFVEKHYDAILSNMLWRLSDMQARTWGFTTKVDRYEKKYLKNVMKAKRNALNGGRAMKIGYEPMSSQAKGGHNGCAC